MRARAMSAIETRTELPRLDEAALWKRLRSGDREAADRTVAVRYRRRGDQGAMALDEFLSTARGWVESKQNEI